MFNTNSNIERELIGAYFLDAAGELKNTLTETLNILNPGDFSEAIPSSFFGVIQALFLTIGDLPTVVAIADRAKEDPVLNGLDIHAIIGEYMTGGATTSVTVLYDRERIKEESTRRAIGDELRRALDMLNDRDTELATVFRTVAYRLERAAENGAEKDTETNSEVWLKVLKRIESGEDFQRVPTGITRLDEILDGGYRPQSLNIVAARPSCGKSALMLQIAYAAAREGCTPLVFSLEMTSAQMMERLYRQHTGENPRDTNTDKALKFSTEVLEPAPIVWIDTPQNIDQIEAQILAHAKRYPDTAIYIDYAGIICKTGQQGTETDITFLDEVTRRLKRTAKQIGAPIILLAQLNRESERAKGEPPKMGQLRGSGGLEQNADTIALLWEPTPANPANDEEGRKESYLRELDIVKNRHGKTGKVDLTFYPNRVLFGENP